MLVMFCQRLGATPSDSRELNRLVVGTAGACRLVLGTVGVGAFETSRLVAAFGRLFRGWSVVGVVGTWSVVVGSRDVIGTRFLVVGCCSRSLAVGLVGMGGL